MADVSLSYGGCYWSSTAATSNATDTPIKAAGTTTSMGLNQFTHSSNRLTYTGTATRTFFIECTFSVSSSGGTNSTMYLYKDGSVITGSDIQRKISAGGDIGAGAVSALVSLATNEYVELWCATDDGDDLTIENGVLSVRVAG